MSELLLVAVIMPLTAIAVATDVWRLNGEKKAEMTHDWCEGCPLLYDEEKKHLRKEVGE